MTTPHVLRSPGEPLLGAGLTALLGVLLFLACNRDSKEAEIVGPQEPVAEEVDRGRLSPASLTLPFSGTVNSSFNTAGFRITQLGQGDGGAFGIQNTGNGHPALIGFTNGYGPGVRGSNTGAGPAGDFRTSWDGNLSPVLYVSTNGRGAAVSALTTGGSRAGFFEVNNPTSFAFALTGTTNGRGPAVNGANEGSGAASLFQITPATNSQLAVFRCRS